MNDFSRSTLRKLARKGISLVGLTAIPNVSSDMPYANATRGYCLDDNGTHKVRTFLEVQEMAK